MVLIPEGIYMMGSPEFEGDADERPQHQVIVEPFFMGKYPVTQAQWRAVAALPKVQQTLNSYPTKFKGSESTSTKCILARSCRILSATSSKNWT